MGINLKITKTQAVGIWLILYDVQRDVSPSKVICTDRKS